MRSAPVILAVLAVAWLSPFVLLAQDDGFPAPPLERYEELIGVLMTPAEAAAWQTLRTTGPRQTFISRFWQVRDPTPGTEANELRDLFMRRARRAASLYSEGDIPGYATDRGKVLIVYGLPDEQEYRAVTAGADSPRIYWSFTQLAEPIEFGQQGESFVLSGTVVLDNAAFVKSAESELRLPLAAAMGSRRTPVPPRIAGEPGIGEATVAADPTVDVAPEVRIWMQMVFAGAVRDQIGLRHRVDFFPAAEGTYTVLGFELDPETLGFAVAPIPTIEDEPDSSVSPSARPAEAASVAAAGEHGIAGVVVSPLAARCTKQRLVEEGLLPVNALPPPSAASELEGRADGDAKPRIERIPSAALKLFGAILQGEPGSENTVHQFITPFCVPAEGVEVSAGLPDREPLTALQGLFRSASVTLIPGTYRIAWGVYDEVTGMASTRDEVIEVPDFSVERLQLSSIVIARPPHRSSSEPVRSDRVYPGIRLGGVLLEDGIRRLYDRNEVLEIVVIATGWQSAADTPGKPQLQVGYRLMLDEETSLARIPVQILDFHVLGQQFPLRQVDGLEPGGSYLLEVRVTDLVSGQQVRQAVPIRLAEIVAGNPAEPQS